MRLSAELYEQIIGGLRSDAHGKDKRREPRVGMAGEVDLISVNSTGKRITGVIRVRDVSPTGIGLLFDQPLEKGQSFILQLVDGKGKRLWLVCQSAYSKKITGGSYSVGARIKQAMREEQIQKVAAETAAAAMTTVKSKPDPTIDQTDVDRISRAILG